MLHTWCPPRPLGMRVICNEKKNMFKKKRFLGTTVIITIHTCYNLEFLSNGGDDADVRLIVLKLPWHIVMGR